MNGYTIDKCKTCKNYDLKEDNFKNKLRCIFTCKEYQAEQSRKIFEYNRAVSPDNFDTEPIYEHGKKVVGSGWKNEE